MRRSAIVSGLALSAILGVAPAHAVASGYTLHQGGAAALSMSCVAGGVCVTDYFVTFSPSKPAAARYPENPIDAGGIQCASVNRCLVSIEGQWFAYDPTIGAAPVSTGQTNTAAAASSLACPTATLCVASGPYVTPNNLDNSGQAWTFDPANPSAITSAVQGKLLTAVACGSATVCVVASTNGGVQAWNPQSTYVFPQDTPPSAVIDPGQTVALLACASAMVCDMVDQAGGVVNFDPSAPAGAVRTVLDEGHRITALSCPTPTQCTAVDDAGGEVTFSPAQPAINGRAQVARLALRSISCTANTLCVAGGDDQAGVVFDPSHPGGATGFVLGQSAVPQMAAPAAGGVRPRITGRAVVGATLTAHTGSWSGTAPIDFSYTWKRCTARGCKAVAHARRQTYHVGRADQRDRIEVMITASNQAGQATATSDRLGPIRPARSAHMRR